MAAEIEAEKHYAAKLEALRIAEAAKNTSEISTIWAELKKKILEAIKKDEKADFFGELLI